MDQDVPDFEDLKPQWKIFAREYVYDWNATRAYKVAYPKKKTDNTAAVNGHNLLRNPKIQAYITHIQKDIEKLTGLSKMKVIQEHQKIGFTSIANLHNTWIDRKEFEKLTEDEKSAISEIETRILKRNIGTAEEPDIVDVEQIKIKLFDKQKSLDAISKMLGYNEPDKIEHSGQIIWNEEKTYE